MAVVLGRETLASGACCSVVLTPGGMRQRLAAAVFGSYAESTEEMGAMPSATLRQWAASVKAGFPLIGPLGGGILAGWIPGTTLKSGAEERRGGSGYMMGLQAGLPVFRHEGTASTWFFGGSLSRSEAPLTTLASGGAKTRIDERLIISEMQIMLTGVRCFGAWDLSGGARWYSGRNTHEGVEGGGVLSGEREGNWAGLVSAVFHLGSEDRNAVVEWGFGMAQILSLGLLLVF